MTAAKELNPTSRSVLTIDVRTVDTLHDLAAMTTRDPYNDFDAYLDEVRTTVPRLPAELRTRLSEFAAGSTGEGALLLRGLTLRGQVPPTPALPVAAPATKNQFSEYVMSVVAASLGEPVGYAEERDGQIFQDVFPVRENAAALSSQSSSADLGYHTEMAFHPNPPDYLLLYTLRGDPDGTALTRFAATRNVLRELDTDVLAALSARDYMVVLRRLHSPYFAGGKPVREMDSGPWVSILGGDPLDPSLRYEPELMQPRHERAAEALRELTTAIERRAHHVALEAGDALILDNRRAVHARSSFRARYDGRDRWLRRMHITREQLAGSGRILTTDLAPGSYR